jgi:hypothetical protein
VPALKHAYSILFGLLFGFFCFGTGMIHSFITAVLTYAIVACVHPPPSTHLFASLSLCVSLRVSASADRGGGV